MAQQKERKSKAEAERAGRDLAQKMLEAAQAAGLKIRDKDAWQRESRQLFLQTLEKHYVLVDRWFPKISGGCS